jgi:hypothetical protein
MRLSQRLRVPACRPQGLRAAGRISSFLLLSWTGWGCDDPIANFPSAAPGRVLVSQYDRTASLCIEGTRRSCSVELERHGDVVSCYQGTQVCSSGRFGECTEGTVGSLSLSAVQQAESAALQFLAFSPAVNCTDNPCNPYCRQFVESPPGGGLRPEFDLNQPPLPWWQGGRLQSYPEVTLIADLHEPCTTRADCQLGTDCHDPAIGGCTHSVCASGEALLNGCNSCVDAVCATQPNCCGTAQACSHDPCDSSTGAPLEPTCDRCVQTVCSNHPECCNVSWNAACVDFIAAECEDTGQSCGCPNGAREFEGRCYGITSPADQASANAECFGRFGSQFRLAAIESATENGWASLLLSASTPELWLDGQTTAPDEWTWRSSGEVFFQNNAQGGVILGNFVNWARGEPRLGADADGVILFNNGLWQSRSVAAALPGLCEGPRSKLQPEQAAIAWTEECVAAVGIRCGARCDAEPALGYGACTERLPTQLEFGCDTFDLSIAATCSDNGVPQVPVCNHGQLPAPAGLRLVHLPAGQANPAAALAAAVDCPVTPQIPPGRCVNVTCPGLTEGSALFVNPPGPGSNTTECAQSENKGIFHGLTCETPLCEASARPARSVERTRCTLNLENSLNIDPAHTELRLGDAPLTPHCGQGEVAWGNSCYFTLAGDVQIWNEARLRCQGHGQGWDLVGINTEREAQFVRRLLPANGGASSVHIGLTDSATEGEHEWTNDTCRAYSNWQDGQPDDFFPAGSEQCVALVTDSTSDITWADIGCNNNAYAYLCEGPVMDRQGACGENEEEGPDGFCYFKNATPLSWDNALDQCQARGAGWSLAQLDSVGAHEFVASLLNCDPSWLNNPPTGPGGPILWRPGFSIDLGANRPYVDPEGQWLAEPPSTLMASVCRGPSRGNNGADLGTLAVPVADASACNPNSSNQFYFNREREPDQVVLCPETCARVGSLGDERLHLSIACGDPKPPARLTTHREIYESNCLVSQWDYLHYDAITPADSAIRFSARTAASVAALTGPFIPLAEASAVLGTEHCTTGVPHCPIDVFEILGAPAQAGRVLELEITLLPGTSGEAPLLRNYRLPFTCPPSD